jgi:hypothetical protein
MEIILAIVVASAVIFFGALISMGNERQRKAIDQLREQVALWAIQDLKSKYERISREVVVEDPYAWFNQLVTATLGIDLNVQFIEMFDNPDCLVFSSERNGNKFLFSTIAPRDILALNSERQGRLSRYADPNPLFFIPHGSKMHDLSILNCGNLFDHELRLAWKGITGKNLNNNNSLWMHQLP